MERKRLILIIVVLVLISLVVVTIINNNYNNLSLNTSPGLDKITCPGKYNLEVCDNGFPEQIDGNPDIRYMSLDLKEAHDLGKRACEAYAKTCDNEVAEWSGLTEEEWLSQAGKICSKLIVDEKKCKLSKIEEIKCTLTTVIHYKNGKVNSYNTIGISNILSGQMPPSNTEPVDYSDIFEGFYDTAWIAEKNDKLSCDPDASSN